MNDMSAKDPEVTVVIPSYNQGVYLAQAIQSVLSQGVEAEIIIVDGGSTDESVSVIKGFEAHIHWWRSAPDQGQAFAVNEGMSKGTAPYVCWLNSDDYFLPGGLKTLLESIKANPDAPIVYGQAINKSELTGRETQVFVQQFDEKEMSRRCIISQPATLIRRDVWENMGGLDVSMKMSMDYDLWWRVYRSSGPFHFVDSNIAVNRDHVATKTRNNRLQHYRESMSTVKKYYGSIPLRWWLAQPYSVWYKAALLKFTRLAR